MNKVKISTFARRVFSLWGSTAVSTAATLWWMDHLPAGLDWNIAQALAALPMFVAAIIYSDILDVADVGLLDYIVGTIMMGMFSFVAVVGTPMLALIFSGWGITLPEPLFMLCLALLPMVVASTFKYTYMDTEREKMGQLLGQVGDLTNKLGRATGGDRPRIRATIRRATKEEQEAAIAAIAAREAIAATTPPPAPVNNNPVGFAPRPQTASASTMRYTVSATTGLPEPINPPPPVQRPSASPQPSLPPPARPSTYAPQPTPAAAPTPRPWVDDRVAPPRPAPLAPSALPPPTAMPAPPPPAKPVALAAPIALSITPDELAALRRAEAALDADHRAGLLVVRLHNGREVATEQLGAELAARCPHLKKDRPRKILHDLKDMGLAGNDGPRRVYWARAIPGLWQPS